MVYRIARKSGNRPLFGRPLQKARLLLGVFHNFECCWLSPCYNEKHISEVLISRDIQAERWHRSFFLPSRGEYISYNQSKWLRVERVMGCDG